VTRGAPARSALPKPVCYLRIAAGSQSDNAGMYVTSPSTISIGT
jgi:hypothetical protein